MKAQKAGQFSARRFTDTAKGSLRERRSFRWRKQLGTGVRATVVDLAKAKGIGKTYIGQILRLTLLAP